MTDNVARWFREITEEEAREELAGFMPDRETRIENLPDGRVRIWRDKTKLTIRPSLSEAMAVIRWYFKEYMTKKPA